MVLHCDAHLPSNSAPFSPAFALFLAIHHLQSHTTIFSWRSGYIVHIFRATFFPGCTAPPPNAWTANPPGPFAMKKRWSQSSSNLLHIEQIVSVLLLLFRLFRTGRLLWTKRQKNIWTLFGTFSYHILCQGYWNFAKLLSAHVPAARPASLSLICTASLYVNFTEKRPFESKCQASQFSMPSPFGIVKIASASSS